MIRCGTMLSDDVHVHERFRLWKYPGIGVGPNSILILMEHTVIPTQPGHNVQHNVQVHYSEHVWNSEHYREHCPWDK